MATFSKSPSRSPRRVLGDKSTNFTPNRIHASDLKFDKIDDIKANLVGDMARVKRPPTGPIGRLAGQKRPIAMVEDAERHEGTVKEPSNDIANKQTREQGKKDRAHTGFDRPPLSTSVSSFHASQEGPLDHEEQFTIQEEMSQTAVDHLNATPLPLNMLQLPSFNAEQTQDSQGLSSLIDFDPEDETLEKTSPVQQTPSNDGEEEFVATSPISDKTSTPDAIQDRRTMVGKKADLLRARLQLAMYKIETNQIDQPFSKLVAKSRTRSPSLPPNRELSPESLVAAARSAAAAQKKPQVANLDAITAPTLVPTAFSARYMPVDENGVGIPSSPPISQEDEDDDANTPRPRQFLTQSLSFNDPQTPSTPNPSLGRSTGSQVGTESRIDDRKSFHAKNLTSSVIKGQAANGLLQLMKMGR